MMVVGDQETRPKLKAIRRRLPRRQEYERLSRNLIPSHYEVYIEPDYPECDTFKGITTIKLQVMDITREMILNGVGLEILEATFEYEKSKEVNRAVNALMDDENELITIEFDRGILPGEGTLSLLYAGTICQNIKGFFHTNYSTVPGLPRLSFGTHFEPTFARHTFPCLDEPDFKATYDLSLVVPPNRLSMSNMPAKKEIDFDPADPKGLKILTFETTPTMSSYLLAFAVGEWDVLEGTTKDGVPVKAYLPVGKKQQGEFGLGMAINCVNYFCQYFGIPFPLPKLDLVTFPILPAAGAMENWGLITFRETVFLVDPTESSFITKQWAAVIIANKIAQQWFGNLVTMNWWTDLWLKEGFASFVSHGAVNEFFPEFRIWDQFACCDMIPAMEFDALTASHPVQVDIRDPGDIGQIFDSISLSKGAALFTMLEKYIGPEVFRRSVVAFLGAFSYKTAKTWQVWETFEVTTGLPVVKVMRTWTEQMGFPLVKIADLEQRREGRAITLTQEKFTADPKYGGNKIEFGDLVWVFPVAFTKSSAPQTPIHTVLMDGTEASILDFVIPNVGPKEWVKVNGCMNGFYRVHYPKAIMREYLCSIRNRSMAPLDRLNLLDDLYALVRCGEAHTVEVLRLLEAYVNEDDYIVWEGMNRVIGGLKEMLEFTELSTTFYAYVINLLRPLKTRIGWEPAPDEDGLKSMFRSSVLVRFISLEDEDTIGEGGYRFLAHAQKETTVSPDLRSVVYRAALATGEIEVFETLLNMYRETDFLEERVRILRALGSSKAPELIDRVLGFCLSEEVQADDLVPILLNMATTNREGRERAWDFFKTNFSIFQQKFPAGPMLSCFLKHLLQGFCSEEMAVEIETFFQGNPLRGTQRSLEQILETIRGNAEWRRRDTISIQNFLNAPPAEVVTIDDD